MFNPTSTYSFLRRAHRLRRCDPMISFNRLPRKLASLLAALAFTGSALAQMGSGWSLQNPQQYIHSQRTGSTAYDSAPSMLRNTWLSTDREHNHTTGGMNGSRWPAEYDYDVETQTETFALYGSTSTTGYRAEVRVQDNYGLGQKRQLEGYLTMYAPMHEQNALQIWGSETGAAQMMIMVTEDNGGSLVVERDRPGSDQLVHRTGIYGKEIKINVIHLQNTSAGTDNGKFQIYADGVLLEEFTDTEDPQNGGLNNQNYIKYGIYQTVVAGHENPKVVWKNVRIFQGGNTPGTTSQTISNFPELMTKAVGDPDFTLNATASSGQPVTYRSSDLSIATIVNNNQVRILKEGTVTIWANQNGTSTYKPAPSKTMLLTIQKPAALYESTYRTDLTTSTPRISVGTFPDAQNKLTVAFWARADALGNMGPVDKLPLDSTGGGGWAVKLRADGAIWFRVGNETTPTDVRLPAGQYAPNTWVHVACTFDGTTMKAYVNGVNPAGGTATASGASVVGNTDLSIGRPSVAAPANIFAGDLRDIRFYDRALSATEIGVISVFPAWLYNGPRSFDGSATDFVSGGTSSGSGSSLTVSFFMDAAQLGNMQPVDKLPADATAPDGAAGGWSVKLRTDGAVWFRIGNETTHTTTQTPAGVYAPNTKIHVACVFSGGTARTYLDGVEYPAATVTGITRSVSNTNVDLRLAVPQRAATSNTFQGELERVRIYHQALSAAQIGFLADGL